MKTASELIGLPVPSDAPLFLMALGAHIAAGVTCVLAAATASLAPKRPGLHPRAGILYAWGLVWLFVSSAVMASSRWPTDAHLLAVSTVALASGAVGYALRLLRPPGWVRVHLLAMGTSFVAVLTGFYVDNGPHLPFWRHLPEVAFWVLPAAVAAPLLVRAWHRHGRMAPGQSLTQRGGRGP